MTVLVTTPMEKELATFRSLSSPSAPALHVCFNASVACITKQHGCSSESMEEILGYRPAENRVYNREDNIIHKGPPLGKLLECCEAFIICLILCIDYSSQMYMC